MRAVRMMSFWLLRCGFTGCTSLRHDPVSSSPPPTFLTFILSHPHHHPITTPLFPFWDDVVDFPSAQLDADGHCPFEHLDHRLYHDEPQ
jgi:hypothetical protein